jgi:hypothetical protein
MRRRLRHIGSLAVGIFALGFALGAQAGPAMFSASFIWYSSGNDITTGTTYPYNDLVYVAFPLGHDCQSAYPYTANGGPSPRYCPLSIFQAGVPATGSGSLATGGATVGAPVGLPTSALSVDVTGFNRTYYPYLQNQTWAYFVNDAGSFFAGGGPAFGKGTISRTGMGQTSGGWVIREGARGFGGAMGLLGFFGVKIGKYAVTGKPGTYVNTNSNWVMVTPIGRVWSATPTAYGPGGKATNWLNPHDTTGNATNNVNGNVSSWRALGWGTPWTTGAVTVYAPGIFPTILHRSGYDTVTAGGVRNIQLVTPGITHWAGIGYTSHSGNIGTLNLQITPEPAAIVLLVAGGGILALLHHVRRRS